MGKCSTTMFSHAEALAIIRLMNEAYKAGVRDAEWVNDAGRCAEHIKNTRMDGVYGRVTDAKSDGWKRWKHSILLIGDTRVANARVVELIMRITNGCCTEACLLPLVQDFYNQGLQDWNDNPVSRNTMGIDKKRYPLWTRKGVKNRTFKQMWVDMQTYAFERMKLCEGDGLNKFTPRKFEVFSIAVWKGLNEHAERKYMLENE